MLIKLEDEMTKNISIKKKVNGKDCSHIGAFPAGMTICFTVEAPRELGITEIILRICRDGDTDVDLPLDFISTERSIDTYSTNVDFSRLCDIDALFYYEFVLLRGKHPPLYTSTLNNVDAELSERSDARFRLLIFDKNFQTPNWCRGKTVYHIFVDRFRKGEKEVPIRKDAILNDDWENGIPQFAKEIGDKLSNNVFFGGTLYGVIEKLEYIKDMGADIIYLSPIFEAYSNHKYDTGDYEKVDEMFGGDDALKELISKANNLGIKIILDGVFNHSGDDSKYFDKYGRYGNKGAYSDPDSEYRDWYTFKSYPDEYECWWGIDIHPRLNQANENCRDYFVGENGICAKYAKMGIGGWRLDVTDELSDDFLDMLRESVKGVNPDAIIIGEVWENAADKIAYGNRRRYLRGHQLDSVMNYPLRSAIIDFLRYKDAQILSDTLTEIYSSYPRCVCDCLLNILSTHDTERILTVLGGICDEDYLADGKSDEELSKLKLTKDIKERAKKLLKIAAVIQYTVYGMPSLFYGDEAGIEGYHDPFCRMPYPWGKEDTELIEFYKLLGNIRRNEDALADGDFKVLKANGAFISYSRGSNDLIIAINADDIAAEYIQNRKYIDILTQKVYNGSIPSNSAVILKKA